MKVFFSLEERDYLKIQEACNLMNSCFETAMAVMKSLLELYVSKKDLHKAQIVAAEIGQIKKDFYVQHEAVNQYESSRKASVSSEIISNNVPQMMKNKDDLVKSSTRAARMSGENDIVSKWTSAEVNNSANDCPSDVMMLNKTEGNLETNKIRLGQITSRTEGKRSLSSIESLSVMVKKQDIALGRSARNAEPEHKTAPHVKSNYSHTMEESESNQTVSKLSSSVTTDENPQSPLASSEIQIVASRRGIGLSRGRCWNRESVLNLRGGLNRKGFNRRGVLNRGEVSM